MRTLSRYHHGPVHHHAIAKPLLLLGLMMIFLRIFDGILGYYLPVVITSAGLSKTAMGLIIGFSSVAGALFDFALSLRVRSVHYRRFFLAMFILAGLYALVLSAGSWIPLFLLAMAIWGIYYDLMTFGNHDYLARVIPKEKNAVGYAVLDMTKSFGYALAPPIATFGLTLFGDYSIFVTAPIALFFSFITFQVIRKGVKDLVHEQNHPGAHRRITATREFYKWRHIGRNLWVPLAFIFLLYLTESFFWVIGPLLSEELISINAWGAFFVTAFFVAPLLADPVAPMIISFFGKKRTAFYSLFVTGILMTFFVFIQPGHLTVLLVFLLSFMMTFGYPAIGSAFGDYIRENPEREHEIVGVSDLATNMAYVVGPIFAGILADVSSNTLAFSLWGFVLIVIIGALLPFARKPIRLTPVHA